MNRVLFVTSGIEHPTHACQNALIDTLEQINGIVFDQIPSLEMLPDDLFEIDGLVLYYHQEYLSEKALCFFDQFVSQGGGVLAIHSATASFMECSHYFTILGGRFLDHGPIEPYRITPIDSQDLFSGIPPFFVEDELYLHSLKPGITPHFTALDGTGSVPVVWTHTYGKGRVCYSVPGHRIETMRHPDYQNLLRQSLSWIIGM